MNMWSAAKLNLYILFFLSSSTISLGNICENENDFQCKNGRCILKPWYCDGRNDCGDNSDEENCPEAAAACTIDQMPCSDGVCIAISWRCDSEPDCADGSDELNCNETRCDESQFRCHNGQCVPLSWVCDRTNDCYDGSDEKNCNKVCLQKEFQCEVDGFCIDGLLKCDGRKDCNDGSDERNCSYSLYACNNGMYRCKDGACIYDYEVCDGHVDCPNNEDEINCTNPACSPGEYFCVPSRRCIHRNWICDGEVDCADGSDEKDCDSSMQPKIFSSTTPASECEASKVCNGRKDCEYLSGEGGLCSTSCSRDNGGCSQICQKSPQGSRCSCHKGYRLLLDNRTCDDVDECLEPVTCSHFCTNTEGGFKCSCAEGYYLQDDQSFCKADGEPATLVYLLRDQIIGFNLESYAKKVYLSINNADIRGMDYDALEGIFYWTETNDGTINSYSPDTRRQDILVRSEKKPIFVRYDWIHRLLFYSDYSSNVGVCAKDGRFCKTIIIIGKDISSIAISPTTRNIFWTIWATHHNKSSGLIERVDMDGSNRKPIIFDNIVSPISITVDHILKMIYWVDAAKHTLESADFEGLKRRQILRYGMHFLYAMAVFENYVYLSDWGTVRIIRCEKFTGTCSPIIQKDVKALALLVVHKVMQPKGLNRCQRNHCPQLCLPTTPSFVCMCGDEYDEIHGMCKAKPIVEKPVPDKCPENYCLDTTDCSVIGGEFVCKCPPEYYGNKCQFIAPLEIDSGYDVISWIVYVLFVGITGSYHW